MWKKNDYINNRVNEMREVEEEEEEEEETEMTWVSKRYERKLEVSMDSGTCAFFCSIDLIKEWLPELIMVVPLRNLSQNAKGTNQPNHNNYIYILQVCVSSFPQHLRSGVDFDEEQKNSCKNIAWISEWCSKYFTMESVCGDQNS